MTYGVALPALTVSSEPEGARADILNAESFLSLDDNKYTQRQEMTVPL
jgi:hypothetical protein